MLKYKIYFEDYIINKKCIICDQKYKCTGITRNTRSKLQTYEHVDACAILNPPRKGIEIGGGRGGSCHPNNFVILFFQSKMELHNGDLSSLERR